MSVPKHTFFCPDLNYGLMDESESLHASRVLRMSIGDEMFLIDGKGRKAKAKITTLQKKEVGFEITEEISANYSPLELAIGICPTKNIDRTLFFVEKCTEMGIREIYFLQSSNSERVQLKIEKIQKTALSALKQSGNLFLPKLYEISPLKSFLTEDLSRYNKMFAHCESDEDKKYIDEIHQKGTNSLILIGPEGDFSLEEIDLLKENGFIPITLGNSRLRTETAGIIACHSIYDLYR